MGTDCTGSYKVARPHKKGSGEYEAKKESAKPIRNVYSGKPELRHHQQSFLPQTSLVLSSTSSLELRLVSSAILEHTINNTSHSWLGSVIISNDRRTSQICTILRTIKIPVIWKKYGTVWDCWSSCRLLWERWFYRSHWTILMTNWHEEVEQIPNVCSM